ncbi:MAG TPA: phosphoribosylanthranilate isomerase [Burkholderiales bacterium]|nr:phosphoribosylanthranilate isomerase [Burkholderiales bacterium]
MTSSLSRTRIKICGITREQDLEAAVEAGADAIGFVFYPPSKRCITPERARVLADLLPPFVTATGLFVNESYDTVRRHADVARLQLLQFHGEESPSFCELFTLPYMKAARIAPDLDLLEYAAKFSSARSLLLDAFTEGYGGGGEVFDWSLIPREIAARAVLSGGLHAANVGAGIKALRPLGVDVSSGVEQGRGIKDAALIRQFVAAVKAADADLQGTES